MANPLTRGKIFLVPFGFPATGLRVGSVLRLHRLMTLSAKIIQRELGRLSPALENEAAEKLGVLFALK